MGPDSNNDERLDAPHESEIILDVQNLKKYFPIQKGFFRQKVGYVKAVDDVSFYVKRGETLGLVGESGCGKSTTARCILRAIKPTSGKVLYYESAGFSEELSKLRVHIRNRSRDAMYMQNGDQIVDFAQLSARDLRSYRHEMQMIFQDPFSSLNPRMTVMDIVGEPLQIHGIVKGDELRTRVRTLLEAVGLKAQHMNRYPYAFSGGQRQRIGIARALALNPRLIVADEPVSALDVSVQAQVLNLLEDLQKEFGLTYLFIAHDLSVVEHISDRVAVMYLGNIAELAQAEELYAQPRHPYTEALLSAVPSTDPDQMRQRILLEGDVPSPSNPPPGCKFHPRCRYAKDICAREVPEWRELGKDHWAACHRSEELSLAGI